MSSDEEELLLLYAAKFKKQKNIHIFNIHSLFYFLPLSILLNTIFQALLFQPFLQSYYFSAFYSILFLHLAFSHFPFFMCNRNHQHLSQNLPNSTKLNFTLSFSSKDNVFAYFSLHESDWWDFSSTRGQNPFQLLTCHS